MMKTKTTATRRVLALFMSVLMLMTAWVFVAPTKAAAYDNYSKSYTREWLVSSGTNYVTYFATGHGKVWSTAKSPVTGDGYNNIIDKDLNDGAGGKYICLGFKKGTTVTEAATCVMAYSGSSNNYETTKYQTINGKSCAFTIVGKRPASSSDGDGDGIVDLNKDGGGNYIYLYVCKDPSAGAPITDFVYSSSSSKSGYTPVKGTSDSSSDVGSAADMNRNAGGDDIFLHFQSSGTQLNSDTLRSEYAHKKWIYENGGDSNTTLKNALDTASAILADLNDGYTTSYNQTSINNAANALQNAIPALSLDVDATPSLSAGKSIWYKFTPSTTKNYIFFTHASFDTKYELYAGTSTSASRTQDDGSSAIRDLLGHSNYQVYDEMQLTAGTTYYFRVNAYSSSSSGSTPIRVATPVKVTFNATGGTNKEYNLPKSYSTLKLDKTGVSRSGHTLVGWSESNTSSETLFKLKSATITVPSSDKTYYALWSPDNAPTLTYDTSYTATIDADGEIEYYQFTPEKTGKYIIYGTGNTDSYVLRYDPTTWRNNGTYIDVQDDSSNSSNGNTTGVDFGIQGTQFFMLRELTAGTTYLYGVKYYNTDTGSLPFRFEKVYTIDYNANGGSGAPTEKHDKYYNHAIVLSSTEPTREGYDFLGWATSSSATAAEYQPGDNCNINDDATLYAVWQLKTYNVTLNASNKGYTVTTAPAATVQNGGSVSFTITLGEHYSESEAPTVTATNGTVGTPVKNGNEITYTVSNITAATTITVGDATVNTYTITWKNWDGTVLGTSEVAYGATPQYNGATPTRQATAQYTYTFIGWDPMVSTVSGDKAYTAQFDYAVNKYTVTWKNEDGTVLETNTDVAYGETPQYNGATPTKAPTAQYAYTFSGWSPTIANVTGDVTYTATFTEVENKYTVTFVDEDGTTVLKAATEYTYGTPAASIVKPDDPTKQATAQYTYTFAGWSPEIADVTANAIYTATYSSTVNTYTVTWLDENDSVLEKDTNVAYGATPSYDGETPTKTADAQYTYEFDKWTPDITNVTGDATYKATYKSTVNEYTITWLDGDGNTLKTDSVAYGATPAYDGETPTKTATAQHTYTFNNTWSPEIVAVTEAATYTAQFTPTVNQYTVTFVDEDGETVLKEEKQYDYGTPAAEIEQPAAPTKTATAQYTYTFSGWTPEVAEVTDNVVYKATYSSTVNQYSVTFVDEDGTVLKEAKAYDYGTAAADIEQPANPTKEATAQYTYTFNGWTPVLAEVTDNVVYKATYSSTVNQYSVTFVDEDGETVLKEAKAYDYGTPAADIEQPVNPTKAPTAQYTYTFTGWTPEIAEVTENVVYKATYSSTVNQYTVIWKNEDGTVLETDENVPYGTMPAYDGETPTKAATAQYTYAFAGWDPVVVSVAGDATYTATYSSNVQSYDVKFLGLDGVQIGATQSVAYGGHATPPDLPTKDYDDDCHYVVTWDSDAYTEVTEAIVIKAVAEPVAHSFTTYTSDNNATCLVDGTKTAKCEGCAKTHTIQDEGTALGHSFGDWIITANASCEEAGSKYHTCSRCDVTETQEIPALGHTLTLISGTPSTCQQTGIIDYYKCSVCGRFFKDEAGSIELTEEQLIDPIRAHNFGNPRNNNDRVTHTLVCIYGCGTYGPREEHSFTQKVETRQYQRGEATCTEPATYFYSCVCGEKGYDSFSPEGAVALGHAWKVVAAEAPTCTKNGHEAYEVCTRCGDINSESGTFTVLPATGHGKYAKDNNKSGQTADGSLKWTAYSCPNGCGDYYMQLSVTAKDSAGNPVSGVNVQITDKNGKVNLSGKTNANGVFNPSESVKPGIYTFTLTNGSDKTTATITLSNGQASGSIGTIGQSSSDSGSGSSSGSGSGSSSGSSGGYRCPMCDFNDSVKNKPVISWFVIPFHAIFHFFARLFNM